MKIADFDGGTGTGAPDVDAAICGGTLSPLGLTITVMLLLNLKMHSAGWLLPHIFTRFHRAVDFASRRIMVTVRLRMHVH